MGCHIVPVPGKTDGLAEKLLQDTAITQDLSRRYLQQVAASAVDAKDVVDCVKDIITGKTTSICQAI